jgi:hypothetical protein
MRSKSLQDLTELVPEVAASGMERMRRGGRIAADYMPVSTAAHYIGDSWNRLADLAERTPLPSLPRVPRRRSFWQEPSTRWILLVGSLLAVAAAVLPMVLRKRGTGEDDDAEIVPPIDADTTADSSRQGVGAQRDRRASSPSAVPGARRQ